MTDWKDIDKKASAQNERNQKLKEQRLEKTKKIASMTNAELLQYYAQIEKENDEFLMQLGIQPNRTQDPNAEEKANKFLENLGIENLADENEVNKKIEEIILEIIKQLK